MPSAWTNVDANFPTITQDGDIREQISAIYNYMYSLTEELKYTLENLDKTNWNTTAMEKFTGEFTTQIKAVDGEVVRALSLIEGLNERADNLQTKSNELAGSVDLLGEKVSRAAIIEIVNNSAGTAYKYSNGFMMCVREVNTSIECSSTWGSLYIGQSAETWNFAAEFAETPKVTLTVMPTSSTSCFQIYYSTPVITKTGFKGIAVARPIAASGSVPIRATIIAYGTWK